MGIKGYLQERVLELCQFQKAGHKDSVSVFLNGQELP